MLHWTVQCFSRHTPLLPELLMAAVARSVTVCCKSCRGPAYASWTSSAGWEAMDRALST